jgi:hypothetical protein
MVTLTKPAQGLEQTVLLSLRVSPLQPPMIPACFKNNQDRILRSALKGRTFGLIFPIKDRPGGKIYSSETP